MGSILYKWAQRASIGAKLAAALVLVTVFSSLMIAGLQQWYVRHAAENYAKAHLNSHLKQVVNMVERTQGRYAGPVEALRHLNSDQFFASQGHADLLILGVNPQGDLVAPPLGDSSILPPPETLRHIANSAWGVLSLTGNDDRPLAVAYDRVPSGELILAVVSSRVPLSIVNGWPVSLLTALLVAAIVVITALLWSRWCLAIPLRRLTRETQMAARELAPPAALGAPTSWGGSRWPLPA